MDKDETGPERTCIVTRRKGAPDSMIRFVAGPGAIVVADLRRRLPGRGVWVTASELLVAEAVKRHSFSRGLKMKVQASSELPRSVGDLLAADALQSLAMANKAGALTVGFAKVETALANGVPALIHASDAAADGVRKLEATRRRLALGSGEAMCIKLFSSEQLDLALGRTNVIHAALAAGPAGLAFLTRCRRLMQYRSATVLEKEAEVSAASV